MVVWLKIYLFLGIVIHCATEILSYFRSTDLILNVNKLIFLKVNFYL